MIQNHELDFRIFGEEMQYVEVELDSNETAIELLKIDTGCIVGFTSTIDYDIQFIGGIKNSLFGGEGLFFASLRGPGTVWIQTLPISRLAGRILQYATTSRKEEGSVLGGLGNLLDGDGWR